MSDVLGTQFQTLFIRDIAILDKELNIKKYIFKQMIIGTFLSLIIGFLTFLIISIFWKQTYIAFIIAWSMFITLVTNSLTSLLITSFILCNTLQLAVGIKL